MSNTINPAVQNQGMLCTIKDTALTGVNWCGNMISSGWEGIKNLVSKVIEYARPFFSNALKYIADVASKVKAFTIENKTAVGAALGALLTGILGVLAIQAAFKGSDGGDNNQVNTNEKA